MTLPLFDDLHLIMGSNSPETNLLEHVQGI
jgi:hypothetical protein